MRKAVGLQSCDVTSRRGLVAKKDVFGPAGSQGCEDLGALRLVSCGATQQCSGSQSVWRNLG